MKKFLSIVTVLMVFSLSAYGQGFGWGIKGGVSNSTMTIDVSGTSVPTSTENLSGVVAGAYLNFDLIFLNLQVDALYAQKGSKLKIDGIYDNDLVLNYLSIPAVAKFVLFPAIVKPYLAGGIEYSTLLSVEGTDLNGDDVKKEDFENSDFGLVAALGADFGLQVIDLNVDIRYVYGLNNVSKTSNLELKNQSVQITVGLEF